MEADATSLKSGLTIKELRNRARLVRRQVLEMIATAGKGHIGSSFSCVELLTALYYGGILRFNPRVPYWPERDRLILSKGQGCQSLYAILANIGFFPVEELSTFCQKNSRLEGHPGLGIPGIDIPTGSLGNGLGIGAGLALGAKIGGKGFSVVVLLGDGECYEGAIWEAAMFAAHHKLRNLTAIIDRNGQSAIDFTEHYNKLEPLAAKWMSFGWEVQEIDGHSFPDIFRALFSLREKSNPLVVIASTLKGKGLSFMEGKLGWHQTVPTGDLLTLARRELND